MLLVGLLAFATMYVTDILSTVMVMAEAREMGWFAGALDAVAYLFSIACTSIAVGAINGHHATLYKGVVIAFITAANLFGTKGGQRVGSWLIHDKKAQRAFAKLGASPAHALTDEDVQMLQTMAAAARSGR